MTDARLEQSLKALFDILFTELGIVIDVRLVQLEKAYPPILVKELGIVIDVRLEQLEYLLLVDYQYYTL